MALQTALSDTVWVAASLLFALFGIAPKTLDWSSRIAVRFATGTVIGGAVMYVESLAGVAWTRLSLAIPLLIWSAGTMLLLAMKRQDASPALATLPFRSTFVPILPIVFTIYGVATARITSGDLLYFWGPKAQHFLLARTIDTAFLGFPHYYLMHPDYPPLQPLVYVWSSIAAGRFSYFGATFLTPLYLLATVLAFRGFCAQKLGNVSANAFATLLAALLAFAFGASQPAGGADPQLVLFAVVALSALAFAENHAVAAIALAGASFTKVEGAAFAIIVVIAWTLVRREWRRSLALLAPAAILLGSWIAFAKHHGLLDSYARGGTALHFETLGIVLYVFGAEASYRALYLPWLAAAAPLVLSRNWRHAAFPLLVVAGTVASTIFFYLHEPDSVWWIKASAERVLLVPLATLLVAGAASVGSSGS